MTTRRQDPEDRQFRQDAFSSSTQFERGILGNLVAARSEKLSDRGVIAVLWWLQQVSWRDGGLAKFAADFLAAHQHLIGTPFMHEFGQRPGQIYSTTQVKILRGEFRRGNPRFRESFLLKGERPLSEELAEHTRKRIGLPECDFGFEERIEYPSTYPAQVFRDRCKIEPEGFVDILSGFLVDPASDIKAGLWNFPGLYPALCAWREREAIAAREEIVGTEITRRVFDELDFAFETRSFVLIEGREGIGKSEATVNWCKQHPGQAVYVRLEAAVDETTFLRSIARAIGTACSYGCKAVQMRLRIQDALQAGHLILCFDEAHFLWPQSVRSNRSAPMKVEWLRTALVDFNVPVALISTPQYFAQACDRFRKGGWNSLQIQRRIARTTVLPTPEAVPAADILNVVKRHFPAADGVARKRIAAMAIGTVQFLTMVVHIRKRTDFLSSRRPGASEAAVLDEAMRDMGLPEAAETAATTTPQRSIKPPLRETQAVTLSEAGTPSSRSARPVRTPEFTTT